MDRSSSQSPEVVALLKEKIIPLAQNIDEIFSDNSLYSEAVGDFRFIIQITKITKLSLIRTKSTK